MTDNTIVPYPDSGWQVFKFGEIEVHGKLDESGEPVFIASEVCAALGLANVSRALKALDPDEKLHMQKRNETAGRQGILAVTESGLYHLVFKSQTDEAQTFKRWIAHEVLPALRKTGSYSVQQKPGSALAALDQIVAALHELHDTQAQQALAIESINDRLLDSDYHTVRAWCQQQHIKSTPALLQKWGRECSAYSLANNIEIKRVDEGWNNVGRYHVSVLLAVCVAKPKHSDQLSLPGGAA